MKYLICGDIHATTANIAEVKALFAFMADKCHENKINSIILLGDQTDTHGVQALPVLHMYKELFAQYSDLNFILVVGNHDFAVNGSRTEHSMFAFKQFSNVTVVDDMAHFDDFDVISYCRTEEEFLAFCNKAKSNKLICHQEFDGCQFENGFYSKNGFDVSKIPYQQVISGHIHKEQKWDKIHYPGAPRWMTKSDANEAKLIHLWDGRLDFKAIHTGSVCRQIFSIDLDENSVMPALNTKDKFILNVTGTRKFIQKVYEKYVGKAEIKTFVIDAKNVAVKESVGINKALEKFVLDQYVPQYGIEKDVLLKEIFNRLL